MRSVRVVFPESIWAEMPMLRCCFRLFMEPTLATRTDGNPAAASGDGIGPEKFQGRPRLQAESRQARDTRPQGRDLKPRQANMGEHDCTANLHHATDFTGAAQV